ncbi:MAG: tetratricopeptide repeat-containing sensor histidine kinase [Bacteroidota bacterium]
MKRILLITISLYLACNIVAAQDSGTDSLLLKSRKSAGSNLAMTYYKQANELLHSFPDSALYYANRAEIILQKGDPDNLLPHVYKSKGMIYQKKLVTDRSLLYYRKAYDAFIKLSETHEVGECALRMGNIYYDVANFSDAYFFYMQSLNAYEKSGDQLGIARMQNNLGIVAHDMGKLSEAERHYMNAREIYREIGLAVEESGALSNIGLIFYDKEQYDSALLYFDEVMERIHPDSVDSSVERYILSGVYNNTALAYSQMDEHQKALVFYRRGIKLAIQGDDIYNLGTAYTNLGSLYGELREKDSALFYLHRSLKIAQDRGFRHLELDAYEELSKLHARSGSYASAYNWLLRYDTVYKDLFNENQSEQIARLRTRYEQELKDREIEQLHSESQVQRMLNKVFIVFIVVIIILVIIITVNLRSKKQANRMLAERNLQISSAVGKLSESEKELQRLNKSKDRIFTVVAHDLRNPVSAVAGFSELLYENFEQFPVETQKEYMLQIVHGTQRIQNLLENLLIWARSQMKAIKFNPESLLIKDLLDACAKELTVNLDHKKVTCQINATPACTVFADRAMINTVLRNLVMNAIKFSFPGGKIWITSHIEENMCHISVTDEGIGIQPEIQERLFDANEVVSSPGTTGESGSGLGLVICKEFMERNQGEIRVESEPGNGSSFIVSLPLSAPE